jgi:hypothetical protein
VHRVFGNLKTWLRGTFHGVSGKHLPRYLAEFSAPRRSCVGVMGWGPWSGFGGWAGPVRSRIGPLGRA